MGMTRCDKCAGTGRGECRHCRGLGVVRIPGVERAMDNRPAEVRHGPDLGDDRVRCQTCGLLESMPGRQECLRCILKMRGEEDSPEAPGIGDS